MDIKIFRIVFLSHSAEKSSFRRGILKCFFNFGYRRSFMDERGRKSSFSVDFFYITVPKITVGEIFRCFIHFWYPKSLHKRGG